MLRRVLLRGADALLPPAGVLLMRSFGIGQTQVIAAMAELGVADALGGGRLTAAQLAPRVRADADALHRLLRMAAVDGLVRLDRRGRFRLTRLGSALRTDAPISLHAWARYMGLESTRRAWGDLTESVRTGESAFRRVNGTSVWDWFASHPEEERLFAEAMRSLTQFDAPALGAASMWPEQGVVCDVAGGTGTVLAAILARRPALRGMLVEAPGVLAEAEGTLRAAGVRDRVELVEGDLLGTFEAPADVYVLKNVLHDWDDATCACILASVRANMPPGSRLVLAEQLQERNRPHPVVSTGDLQMLTQCENGRERSREELRGLLRGAGLTPARIERIGATALVEGVSPPPAAGARA
ncbi:MAG: acetylserotonin O-methyltransferase [Actinomycetota bacterium]|nr:acetylserotonin O-methyltransferase [Actinomycetota bacterium]